MWVKHSLRNWFHVKIIRGQKIYSVVILAVNISVPQVLWRLITMKPLFFKNAMPILFVIRAGGADGGGLRQYKEIIVTKISLRKS